jgi:hypothetical protein
MANQSEEVKIKREHLNWLHDYAQWRSEHRQALMMLTKVQAAILEREAALESQEAEVHAHESHLRDYEVVEYAPGSPDPAKQAAEHSEFEKRHNHAREIYEQTKQRHVNILAEVTKLFEFCKAATEGPRE